MEFAPVFDFALPVTIAVMRTLNKSHNQYGEENEL